MHMPAKIGMRRLFPEDSKGISRAEGKLAGEIELLREKSEQDR
jgi:hypothetical protein